MKTALILSSLLVGVQSFGVAPITQGRVSTHLYSNLPEDMMTAEQKEVREVQNKWNEIRMMDRATAEKELSGEWLESYNRFFAKYDDDMVRMTEIAKRLEKMIEPPKIAKKTKGQKKRDAFARVSEREAARAGN